MIDKNDKDEVKTILLEYDIVVPEVPADPDEMLRVAKELKRQAGAAQIIYLKWLNNLHLNYEEVWKPHSGAHATFEEFIDRNKLCSPSWYSVGIKALAELGEATVCTIGLDPAKHVVRINDERARKQAVAQLLKSAEDNETVISDRYAKEVAKKIKLEFGLVRSSTPVSEASRLRAKIEQLLEELRVVKRENYDLKRENQQLRKLVEVSGKPGPRKTKAKAKPKPKKTPATT